MPRPPRSAGWHIEEMEFQQINEHGPSYSPVEWFGPMSAAMRQKLRRDVDMLTALGLVVPYKAKGRAITNLALTAMGQYIADRLNPGIEV